MIIDCHGHYFNYDDTKRYIDAAVVSAGQRARIYCDNALKVYARLGARLKIK